MRHLWCMEYPGVCKVQKPHNLQNGWKTGSKSQWKYLTLFLFIDQPKKPRLMKLYCNCSSNIFTKGLKEKKLHYFFFLCILLNLSGENCIWEFSSLDYWPHMVMMILQTFIWISHQALELLLSFSFRNSCWLF